jgi:hypothetical protein
MNNQNDQPPMDNQIDNIQNNNIQTNNINIDKNEDININNNNNIINNPKKEEIEDRFVDFNSQKLINNPITSSPIPLGMILTPFKEIENIPLLHRAPLKCTNCKGILNLYCKLDINSGKWKCNICSNENNSSNYSSEDSISFYPELCFQVVEYIDPTQQFSLLNSVNVEEQKKTFFFLIDTNL